MASFNFTNLARHLVEGRLQFSSTQDGSADTFKVMLVSVAPTTTDTTGNQDTWIFRSSVTNEVTGTGYSSSGISQPFTLNALTLTGAGGKQSITWSNITNGWTNATFSAVGAIIYKDTGSAATDLLLHFVDFGATVSCSNGSFSITYSSTFDISTT